MPITDFLDNTGGVNITDSFLSMKDNQAALGSYNYDYSRTGAIKKGLGPSVINNSADSELISLGLLEWHSATEDIRTVVRAAGTKLQTFDPSGGSIANLAQDTSVANTDFLSSGSTQPVVGSDYTNGTVTELWMAGGGMDAIYGYNGTNITANGVQPPAGALTTSVTTSASGDFTAPGTYQYAVAYLKRSSQSLSNAALDVSAVIANVNDEVVIDFTALTPLDTTLIEKIFVFRSAVSGVVGFTTGDLIAMADSTDSSYTDDGSFIANAQNVPRAGNIILDNSPLPTGAYKTVTTFKQRLVTASGNNVYISDLNKSESWPLTNRITLSTGGPITAVSTIGYNAPFSTAADEYLVILKEDELWIVTGDDYTTWILKFVDEVGCVGQSLIVPMNGFTAWMDYKGIYIWDASSKPIYCSRPIENLWSRDGDVDKVNLYRGWGQYYRKTHQIIWQISHRTKGTQMLRIKMDLRLTLPAASQEVDSRIIDGIFSFDTDMAFYAGLALRPVPTYEEILIGGDALGKVYTMYNSVDYAVPFVYVTKPLNMGSPTVKKRFKRIILWIEKYVDKDLTVLFAADFRNRVDDQSIVKATMAPRQGLSPALWDFAYWDTANWDDYQVDIAGLEFNLHSDENNAEGDALQLQFVQQDASAPVVIHGFSIDWEPVAATSRAS